MKASTNASVAAFSRSPTIASDVESQTHKPRSPVALSLNSFTPLPWIQIPLCFLFGTAFAISTGAFAGFLTIIIGHAILRTTHHAGYDLPLSSSMKVGATGGAPVIGFAMVVLILASAYRQAQRQDEIKVTRPDPVSLFIHVAVAVGLSAASGMAGVALLHTFDQGFVCLDTTYAARAGALGATIISSPAVLQALLLMISDRS